jgi:single-strand DNA-binding protein
MNLVVLKGRLTKDPETRYSQAAEPVAIVSFGIAVNRKFKKDGQPDADFFNCTAFGKTGEFVAKYFTKGQEMLLEGSINNRSWEDSNGQKRRATDIIAEQIHFCGSKSDNVKSTGTPTTEESDDDAPY